jgi:Holliday junction resolvasome RuvABC DNA-binding subunit
MDMGTTTIQVEEKTKRSLDDAKKRSGLKTYDAVIDQLLKTKTKTMYGFLAKEKKMSFEEMMKELRDERDRE